MTLKRKIAGLDFKHPVIAAPGPNVELNIVREVAPFQGIPVTKTISVRACEPPKQNMAYVKGSVPAFLNKEGHSEFPLAAWAEKLEEMQRAGFSPIASVGYTAEDVWIVREILQDLVAGWEVSTHYTTPQKSMQTVRTLVESGKPVFLKVSPNGFLPKPGEVVAEDFEAKLNEYVRSFESLGVAGFVGINSLGPTNVRYGERHALAGKLALGGNAWLSGPRIRRVGLTFVDRIAGNLPVGGVGGISTYKDALAFMAYGADFVGVCTEAILKGPEVYTKIAEGIGKFMEKNGYSDIDAMLLDLRDDVRRDTLFMQEDMGEAYRPFESWDQLVQYVQNARGEVVSEPRSFSYAAQPTLSLDDCIECRSCASEIACTRGALTALPQLYVNTGSCESCYVCADVCRAPVSAVQRPKQLVAEM